MRIKISTKLIIGFMLVVLLMVALTLYSVNRSQKSLQESVGESSTSLIEEMLKRIDNIIYFRIEHLRARSHGLWLQKTVSESNQEFEKLDNIQEYINKKDKKWTSAPKEEITPFMQELISNELSNNLRKEFIELYEKKYGYRVFGEVSVTNKYGANVAQTGRTSDYRQEDEEWWQIAKERGLYVGDVEYGESAGIYSISIGIRVDNEKGNFIGIIKAAIDVTGLIKEAVIATKKYETTEIELITKDGRLIYATKPYKFLEDVSEKEFFKNIKGESGFFVAEEGGREKLFSYAHSKGYRDFEGLQWMLVVRHDAEEVLKPAFVLRNSMIAASLILITMSILIAFFISRSISKPVTKLRDATIEIARGNLDTQVEVESNDEIGELATSFKKMIEDLRRTTVSRDYTRGLFEANLDALVTLSAEGKITDVNRAMELITGLSSKELIGTDFSNYFIDPDAARKVYQQVFRDNYVRDYPLEIKHRDGRVTPVLYNASVYKDAQGRVAGVFAAARDITERRRAEEALKQSAEQLEEANIRLKEADRLKSIFLASMSHELRTPLNSIIGFTGIILMGMVGEISEEQRKQLIMVKNSAHHLLSLINDLLDISKIEAGKVELSLEEFRLDDVVGEVVETFSPAVMERGLELLTEVPEGITPFSDRRRVKQVLMNLVSNAVKFTDQGSVRITARVLRDENLEMRVTDTGIGIKKEGVNRLFEPFQQIDMSLTKKYEGTGLGLYLCKKLLALLGGEISAKSEYDRGSEFTFTIPLRGGTKK
ncbi:MAG: PAS domain S-box protein [Deltaproteobacteria bacterium]|nr:PAS domain S-box protein [Deltaproteobacteria bacterium]